MKINKELTDKLAKLFAKTPFEEEVSTDNLEFFNSKLDDLQSASFVGLLNELNEDNPSYNLLNAQAIRLLNEAEIIMSRLQKKKEFYTVGAIMGLLIAIKVDSQRENDKQVYKVKQDNIEKLQNTFKAEEVPAKKETKKPVEKVVEEKPINKGISKTPVTENKKTT